MKKIFLTLFFLSSFALAGIFEESFKIYPQNADNLFMSALSAINQSGIYQVVEMQSKNGYILFLHESKYYLLTLTKRYSNQTEIKIMPQNSDFSSGSQIAKTIFAMIDNQLKLQPMEPIK